VDADWEKSDDIIYGRTRYGKCHLLKNMGVNAIRQYTGVPARGFDISMKTMHLYMLIILLEGNGLT